ncbi:MAG: LysO family transporter [Bacteroidales bacterium]|nr:LysO family transporter [Bacteroidales bacterium]MDD6622701.1 LysO family transporter [Bacteroidales bacterium]MDD6669712.1 LysO family transporter [Bacteroidales bacterium]
MLKFIAILLLGIATGYLVRRRNIRNACSRATLVAICALLLIIGFAAGANPDITGALTRLGGEALLIGGAATLGSVVCAAIAYRIFFRRQ